LGCDRGDEDYDAMAVFLTLKRIDGKLGCAYRVGNVYFDGFVGVG
jgi:hypothetical protein